MNRTAWCVIQFTQRIITKDYNKGLYTAVFIMRYRMARSPATTDARRRKTRNPLVLPPHMIKVKIRGRRTARTPTPT